MNEQFCIMCKELKPVSSFYIYNGHIDRRCKPCNAGRMKKADQNNPDGHKARQHKRVERERAKADALYADMLDLMSRVTFKPMTETEWMKIVDHFDGCALCGNEVVETRAFMVQFQKGGRYVPWNMFPRCGACSVYTRRIENPFRWLHDQIGTTQHMGVSIERANRLKQFFIDQMEKVRDAENKRNDEHGPDAGGGVKV